MQELESRKYKKKELCQLFGYDSPIRSTGSRKAFQRKLSQCCKWNTKNCKTTEINIIEVYRQPNETVFEHGLNGKQNKLGKVHWQENSNSKFVAAVLLNKIDYFNRNDKLKNQFVTIKTLLDRCGFQTDCNETANSLSIQIKRNIDKLEKLNIIKVERKYNAKVNNSFIQISENEYLKFKNISKKVWKSLNEPVVEKFHTFYQFASICNDNQYIKSLYYESLSKETNIEFVFESYRFSLILNEDNAKIILDLDDMIFDDYITVKDKINNFVEETEDYFKEKQIEMQEKNKYIPSGFGTGFFWYTKSLSTAKNVVVF